MIATCRLGTCRSHSIPSIRTRWPISGNMGVSSARILNSGREVWFVHFGQPLPLLLADTVPTHSCPRAHRHQTRLPLPQLTSTGRRSWLSVGCHSAATYGSTASNVVVGCNNRPQQWGSSCLCYDYWGSLSIYALDSPCIATRPSDANSTSHRPTSVLHLGSGATLTPNQDELSLANSCNEVFCLNSMDSRDLATACLA